MSYVVYNKATTILMRKSTYASPYYATEAAAKSFLTRMVKKGYKRDDFDVAESQDYYANIEQQTEVTNLMTGLKVKQSVNTPRCCDVSSEQYWSL
jgi:hypothetical protein